jgi:protein ImuB
MCLTPSSTQSGPARFAHINAEIGNGRLPVTAPTDPSQDESFYFVHSFSSAAPAPSETGLSSLPHRPIRLLQRPEPIETIAGVPDGPPLRFRWRRVMHEVAAIEGPERIAPEWWKEKVALSRDYFRAEDTQGQRFWLYREGLYTETAGPRWFMHGLFA